MCTTRQFNTFLRARTCNGGCILIPLCFLIHAFSRVLLEYSVVVHKRSTQIQGVSHGRIAMLAEKRPPSQGLCVAPGFFFFPPKRKPGCNK